MGRTAGSRWETGMVGTGMVENRDAANRDAANRDGSTQEQFQPKHSTGFGGWELPQS